VIVLDVEELLWLAGIRDGDKPVGSASDSAGTQSTQSTQSANEGANKEDAKKDAKKTPLSPLDTPATGIKNKLHSNIQRILCV
jgi:hypothetical protein